MTARYVSQEDNKKAVIYVLIEECDETTFKWSKNTHLLFSLEYKKSLINVKNSKGELVFAIGLPSEKTVRFKEMDQSDTTPLEKWIHLPAMSSADVVNFEMVKTSTKYPMIMKFVGKHEFLDKMKMLNSLKSALYLLEEVIDLNKSQKISPAVAFEVAFKKMMVTGTYGSSKITLRHTPFTTMGTFFHEYAHMMYEKLVKRAPTIDNPERAVTVVNEIINKLLSSESVTNKLEMNKSYSNWEKYEKNIVDREEVFARAVKCFTLLKTCDKKEHSLTGYYIFTSKTNQEIMFGDSLEYSAEEVENLMPLFNELIDLMHNYKSYRH